jgi:spore germination protein GerM/N-acetylneuraminic acid mutarotase
VKNVLALATLLVLGILVAGCGSEHAVSLGPPPTASSAGPDVAASGPSTTAGTTTTRQPISLQVWFAQGERLFPEQRTHAPTRRVATAALEALLDGPTEAERAAGVSTQIPPGTRLLGVSVGNGVATVDLTSEYQSGGGSLSMQVRLGQVVYTLTQFPTVQRVRFELDGAPVNVFSSEGIVLDHPVGRSDYAELSAAAVPVAGSWRSLAAAPIDVNNGELRSVWTGKEMLVFGSTLERSGSAATPAAPVNVAAAYEPAANTWRKLAPPLGPQGAYLGKYSMVWTGSELLLWGAFDYEAYNPSTNRWRRLPARPGIGHAGGVVVWTGREMIGWGGGCCGDAFSDGVAYNPATNRWRSLPSSPLAGSQSPLGVWTGRELLIFVSGLNPEGHPWPARLARAAAYNPSRNTWRRIAPLPEPRNGASAVWDGREVLVIGGAGAHPPAAARVGLAYNPATNRWRRLPAMESGRFDAAAVWTGRQLLVWGGSQRSGAAAPAIPPHGLAYDPRTDRWSPLPQAPLLGRLGPTAVWTGREMIVWGGERPASPSGTRSFADGAAFRPTTS